MWNADNIVKIVTTVVIPILTIIGLGGRRRRLRNEIKENLNLVEEIEKHDALKSHSLASGWLQGRIALDVAKISGINLGTPKSPIPKGTIATATILALGFGLWTYWLDRDGFVWYSVFPGFVSLIMLLSILGMFTGRELPPEETEHLPPGAVLTPTGTANERIATLVSMASSGNLDDRAAPGGQVNVVYTFVRMLQSGNFEQGLSLADNNWLTCRVQAWLWNNRGLFGDDTDELDSLALDMLDRRQENQNWSDFVATERSQFVADWNALNLDEYGFAGRRRRMAQDIDMVILTPTGGDGGYFVTSVACR